MGFLLKIVVFGVAAYTLWMTLSRWYGLLSGRRPNQPANRQGNQAGRGEPAASPQAPPSQPRPIEDTYPCKICGVYIMASARKCERSDCPQPA